jgi:hypothetical protein
VSDEPKVLERNGTEAPEWAQWELVATATCPPPNPSSRPLVKHAVLEYIRELFFGGRVHFEIRRSPEK